MLYGLAQTGVMKMNHNISDIIGEIIEIIVPSTYTDNIELVSNDGWNEIVNKTYTAEQPLFATIFNRQIIFHPAPASAGDIIKLWVYQTDSLADIEEDVEPEVQTYFDRAIEFYATAMLDEKNYAKYMELYEKEMEKHGGRPSLKHLKGTTHSCEW